MPQGRCPGLIRLAGGGHACITPPPYPGSIRRRYNDTARVDLHGVWRVTVTCSGGLGTEGESTGCGLLRRLVRLRKTHALVCVKFNLRKLITRILKNLLSPLVLRQFVSLHLIINKSMYNHMLIENIINPLHATVTQQLVIP